MIKRPRDVCIDCWDRWLATLPLGADSPVWPKQPRWRPAPEPGPRCVTHGRVKKKASKKRAHETKVQRNFGLPPGMYDALLAYQGGTCAILYCRAQGKTRALAVDHDHKCCPGPVSCGKCVRGLLCQRHNLAIGYDADKPEVFESMAAYIRRPPYHQLLEAKWPGDW